jgi:hypothetical protein
MSVSQLYNYFKSSCLLYGAYHCSLVEHRSVKREVVVRFQAGPTRVFNKRTEEKVLPYLFILDDFFWGKNVNIPLEEDK